MADQVISDLFMMFVREKGGKIRGESQTNLKINSSDLCRGFDPNCILEVQDFQLSTGLTDDDEKPGGDPNLKKDMKANKQLTKKAIEDLYKRLGKGGKGIDLGRSAGFESWHKGDRGGPGNRYPVDMQPIEFSKVMDRSSVELLQACIDREVFESAALIKRKAAGGPASGEVFLRIDFLKVLLVDISFDDEMPIKEKYKFISRAIKIQYLPQLPDGSLGAPISIEWSVVPGMPGYEP